jgi:hypothetical protein
MRAILFVATRTFVLLLAIIPAAAYADTLSDLRTAVDGLKVDYEQRIQLLEQRIAQLEVAATQAPAEPAAAAAPPAATAATQTPARSNGNAFNPALSLILAGTYSNLSHDPANFQIAGFIPGSNEAGPGARGFNLGESELTIAANVDPYFFGNVTASVSGDNSISIEEAYFRTTALTHGWTLKGGRYFSGLGYLNSLHAHAWDFVDQPLAYQALLGTQYAQDGAQLKWLAPTDTLIEVGVEAGSGRNFPGAARTANGLNAATGFIHLGGDAGDSASWRAGLSLLQTHAENRRYLATDGADVAVSNAFSGDSKTWAADFIWKWAPHGNSTRRQLKLQGEYLRRTESGSIIFDADARALTGAYRSQQSGWYLQSVYQFRPRWRVGLRYDSLDSGTTRIGALPGGVTTSFAFPHLQAATPTRTTVMLDFSPSEFSRLRTQFAQDRSGRGTADHQFYLQYLFSVGAHGAHNF